MPSPIGELIGGVSGVLGGKPKGVRASIRQTAQGTLRGYQDTGPLSLALNQLYNPSYLALGGNNLQSLLFGQQEQQYNQQVPDSFSKSGKPIGSRTVSGTIPGAPGLLDTIGQAQNRLQTMQAGASDTYRQNQFDQLTKYLPQARAAYEQANPEQAALQRQIGQSASEQLALGDRVNQELAANWRNQNTAQYANMGFRPNNDFVMADDLLRYTGGAQALQGQRQGYALDALSRLGQTQPNYAATILGMNDPSLGQAIGFTQGQQPLTYRGNQFDPYNANTTSLSNNANANAMTAAQQQAAYWGGIGSGTVGTAAAGFGAFNPGSSLGSMLGGIV